MATYDIIKTKRIKCLLIQYKAPYGDLILVLIPLLFFHTLLLGKGQLMCHGDFIYEEIS